MRFRARIPGTVRPRGGGATFPVSVEWLAHDGAGVRSPHSLLAPNTAVAFEVVIPGSCTLEIDGVIRQQTPSSMEIGFEDLSPDVSDVLSWYVESLAPLTDDASASRAGANDLWLLAYQSRSVDPITPELLERILEISQRNNSADQLTGMLLAHEDRFFQVLEGPHDALRARYEKISRDPRHRDAVILVDAPTSQRLFPDWTMQPQDPKQLLLALFPDTPEDDGLVAVMMRVIAAASKTLLESEAELAGS